MSAKNGGVQTPLSFVSQWQHFPFSCLVRFGSICLTFYTWMPQKPKAKIIISQNCWKSGGKIHVFALLWHFCWCCPYLLDPPAPLCPPMSAFATSPLPSLSANVSIFQTPSPFFGPWHDLWTALYYSVFFLAVDRTNGLSTSSKFSRFCSSTSWKCSYILLN